MSWLIRPSRSLTEGARHAGRLLLSYHQWKARALLWAAAIAIGIVAVSFARLADLAIASGIPAGILAPSLSVGAGIGQSTADFFGHAPVPFAILGMCGYLAGVTQAPLSAQMIVMEMTLQHAMVLPLMITAAVATAVRDCYHRRCIRPWHGAMPSKRI